MINKIHPPARRIWAATLAIVLFAVVVDIAHCANTAGRRIIGFDQDWRFLKGDAESAEKPEFNDARWRTLDVPHDWSIEGPFSQTNRTGGAGGFLPSGIGWYRKTFALPSSEIGRHAVIEFDGVMAHSDVWINGQHLGKRPYGYVSFAYDLTPHLKRAGQPNVIAVRADTSQQPASRWYTGAGIYRHVRLVITGPVRIEQWSTFVTTPEVSADQATVRVATSVTNQSSAPGEMSFRISLIDSQGRTVAGAESEPQVVAAGTTASFRQDLTVKQPRRWSLDEPALYQAVAEVRSKEETLDTEITPFGIREAEFRSDTGFWLNGKNFKIKGVCLHHDGGGFGAAVPLRVWERRLELLKELGVNAVRTAHNPVAPEFLDLCDRMGVLVMDEFFDCWTVGKNRHDYHLSFNEWSKTDMRDTIRRDRNHPSIILYSVGNEIRDTTRAELAKGILEGLVEVCHETDPTRPVTQGLFRPNVSGDYTNGLADLLDVIGTNYRDTELLAAHRAKEGRKIIGTEQGHERRIWLACRDNAQHSGQFLWTGIDYLGEARNWPRIGFGSGLLDRTGLAYPRAFERQSWWSEQPMVRAARRSGADELSPTDPGYESADLRRPQVLFCDWTPRNLEAHSENVEVFSNCEEVELFLNGKSLGTKATRADDGPINWQVPFETGTLKAIGRNNGTVAASHELRTAGEPAGIVLSADRNHIAPVWDDVSHVSVRVVDKDGILIPTAGDLITFSISGPGVIAAVDNGDNASHEPFQASERRAYQGYCLAAIKATAANGRITLRASAPGLKSASIDLTAVSVSTAAR